MSNKATISYIDKQILDQLVREFAYLKKVKKQKKTARGLYWRLWNGKKP